ncbi:MAG: cytochrome c oxidase subunit 3 [Marmoricola sp.]
MTLVADAPVEAGTRRVPGIEGVWVLIAGDMVIFALLFGSFMSARREHTALFEASRHALDLHRGGLNTLLLLTSSWCVVLALRAIRGDRRDAALRWLGFGILGGLGFAVSKVLEYVAEVGAGHTAGSGDFFMYYFMLTGIHLVHVLVGTLVLTIFWFRWRSPAKPDSITGFESAAVFWHMVDLLWIVLFPLLYLVR